MSRQNIQFTCALVGCRAFACALRRLQDKDKLFSTKPKPILAVTHAQRLLAFIGLYRALYAAVHSSHAFQASANLSWFRIQPVYHGISIDSANQQFNPHTQDWTSPLTCT